MQCLLHRWTAYAWRHEVPCAAAVSQLQPYLRRPLQTVAVKATTTDSAHDTTLSPAQRRVDNAPRYSAANPLQSSRVNTTVNNPSGQEENHAVTKQERDAWKAHKRAMKKKFGNEGWNPRKKLSPDTLDGIRTMHASDPTRFTTAVLAEHFEVSPEAIRRILKSKWEPSAKEAEHRRERWEKRGERIWTDLSEMGLKPPKPWRVMGVGKAEPGGIPAWRARRPSGQALLAKKDVGKTKIAERMQARRDVIATRPEVASIERSKTVNSFANRML